jgi:predicted PurR-regulated permease PerM
VVTGLGLLLLWVLRSEVLYVVVAGFVALALLPVVRMVDRRGVPHGVATTIVFILGVLVFAGIVYLFSAPLVTGVTRLSHELPTLVRQAEHGRGHIGRLIKRLHLQSWVSKNAPKLSSDITKILKPAQALSVGAAAASTLLALVTIAVLSFFVLLEAPSLWRGFLSVLPPARAAQVRRLSAEVSRSVTGYLLGNILTSVVAGLVIFVTLSVLGVPFPYLFGLWVALVDLLPLVGGLLAGVPTVVIALLHSPTAGIVTFIVFIVYQQIENHVLNPVVMSKTVRLNPLWVLLAVLVGAKLGSSVGSALGAFVGALLGIPIGGALQVVVRELRRGPDPGPAGDLTVAEGGIPAGNSTDAVP